MAVEDGKSPALVAWENTSVNLASVLLDMRDQPEICALDDHEVAAALARALHSQLTSWSAAVGFAAVATVNVLRAREERDRVKAELAQLRAAGC